MTSIFIKRDQDTDMHMHTRKTCMDTVKRWPPGSQGERPQDNPTQHHNLGLVASRNVTESTSVISAHQAVVFVTAAALTTNIMIKSFSVNDGEKKNPT